MSAALNGCLRAQMRRWPFARVRALSLSNRLPPGLLSQWHSTHPPLEERIHERLLVDAAATPADPTGVDRALAREAPLLTGPERSGLADRVVARIQGLRANHKHKAFKDFAILYRANHQARMLEKALRKANLPYKVSGGQSFFDREIGRAHV